MGFFRWMVGMPLAAAITTGLFLMMAGLIKKEPLIGDPPETPQVNITAKLEQRIDPLPPPRTIPDSPDQPLIETPRPRKPGGGDGVPVPDPIGPVTIELPKRGGGVIQIAPQYPDACRSKGVEGVVIVEFDITDRGEATNVRILSSPDRCFDRDVIRAVRGWRFPAEARRGVTEAIKFEFVE